MSKLAMMNGDDHPDAALKHLLDAQSLVAANRPDGGAYLSGYVVECSLKSLLLLEQGSTGPQPWSGNGHGLRQLHQQLIAVAALSGAKTAKYLKSATLNIPTSPISNWKPGMRYATSSTTPAIAAQWGQNAADVYAETVAEMRIDGVI